MTATALVAFAIVGSATVLIAHNIARRNALAEAERTARSLADTVFVPALPAAIGGDPMSLAQLRRVVSARSKDGSLVRVKVWTRDGTVVYSDDPSITGRQFPPDKDVGEVIDEQRSNSDVSELDDLENVTEAQNFDRLVEVYTPITLEDGSRLAFETYSTDAQVNAAERDLANVLVPVSLGSLLVLLVAQLPLSMWLVRRVVAAQQDRGRLLRNTLVSSALERQTIARELHDGVVQDLSGVGYAIGALIHSLNGTAGSEAGQLLNRVSSAVQDSIAQLRTLMVDIYPPDLSSDGLAVAIEDLAAPLRVAGVTVDISIELPGELAPEIAATLYRFGREGLANVAKHAHARHVWVSLVRSESLVVMQVRDDGDGLAAPEIDRRVEGHLGLQLLRDAATDIGGEMVLVSDPGAGTMLTIRLPAEPPHRS